MTRHSIVITACVVLCLGMCAGVVIQQHQLDRLRAEQQKQLAQKAAQAAEPAQTSNSSPAPLMPPPGLLRLRSQITQLAERRRALAGVRAENERLRIALTNRSTNIESGPPLPPGYIRRTEAQWVGWSSPENSLQSLLWAIQSGDLTNFLRTLTPENRDEFLKTVGDSPEATFQKIRTIPGMRIVSQEEPTNGYLRAEVEIMPGESTTKMTFRQIDGEWKIDSH